MCIKRHHNFKYFTDKAPNNIAINSILFNQIFPSDRNHFQKKRRSRVFPMEFSREGFKISEPK